MRVARLIAFTLAAALAAASAHAYETDQFNHRLEPLRDSAPVLDAHVNAALADIVEHWHGPRDDWKMVNAVYHNLGGLHWVDHIEKWAAQSPEVDKLRTKRHESIYAGHPIWATRVTALFGVGATFKVDGVLIGSDKLGHFFSQGRKFYRRWLKSHDEAQAAEHSAYTERAIFGQITTGDYSNADLVANYEGHRFYRSLFEDGVTGDKPAILRWEQDHWVLQRPFAWVDHVNAYWDEALEINHFDKLLKRHMRERLLTFCGDYAKDPPSWTIAPAEQTRLNAKYAMLQLRDTTDLQLPQLCGEHHDEGAVAAHGADASR